MKLDLDQATGHLIRGFRPGELRVGAEVLTAPAIVTAEQLIRDWEAPPVAQLAATDLDAIIALDPEVVILGTGVEQVFPPPAVSAALLTRGIGFEVMATAAACRTYNVLVTESRRVAAALYLR